MSDSSSSLPPPHEDEDFREERRILLNGVAESLRRILDKMNTVNDNLAQIEQGGQQVKGVADLWKAAPSDAAQDDNE